MKICIALILPFVCLFSIALVSFAEEPVKIWMDLPGEAKIYFINSEKDDLQNQDPPTLIQPQFIEDKGIHNFVLIEAYNGMWIMDISKRVGLPLWQGYLGVSKIIESGECLKEPQFPQEPSLFSPEEETIVFYKFTRCNSSLDF